MFRDQARLAQMLFVSNWRKICGFVLVAATIAAATIVWIEQSASSADDKSDLYLSLVISIAGNAIFFLLFGVGFALVVSTDPSKLNLESRLRLIFASSNTSSDALGYVMKEIRKIGAIISEINVTVTFSEIFDDQSGMKVVEHKTGILANMFHRENYTQELKMRVVPGYDDPTINEISGEIVSASYTMVDGSGLPKTTVFGQSVAATLEHPAECAILIDVTPSASISYAFQSWFYQNVNSEVWWGFRQFVEHGQFEFRNSTEKTIALTPTISEFERIEIGLPERIVMNPASTFLFEIRHFPPTRKLSFKLVEDNLTTM